MTIFPSLLSLLQYLNLVCACAFLIFDYLIIFFINVVHYFCFFVFFATLFFFSTYKYCRTPHGMHKMYKVWLLIQNVNQLYCVWRGHTRIPQSSVSERCVALFFNFDKYSKLLMKLSINHSVKKKKINNIVKEINALISLRYLQLQLDYLKIIFRYVFDSLLRHTEMYLVHFCNVHLKILFHILLTEINIPSISIHKHPKMCWSNLIPNKKFASLVK